MDFDKEYELENAGIDAFDFSLMDEDERVDALRDAGLDPDDFDGVEFDSSFDAWSALQDNGLSLWELQLMDDEEKREALEDAGLDPDDYDTLPSLLSTTYTAPTPTPKSAPTPTPAKHKQTAKTENIIPPSIYQFCSVVFPGYDRKYSYRVVGFSVAIGDIVIVPTGPENKPSVAKVVSTGVYTEEVAPYPVDKVKFVLRFATDTESTPFNAVPVKKAEEPVVRQTPPPAKKSGKGAWWFALIAVAVLLIVIAMSQQPKSSTTRSTSSTYSSTGSSSSSYSRSYSTTPTCPPVNRELAMTREDADRLRGTGYHGTRPNSSAENTELAAAQTKCKNCGYRTHNGSNSLCDYCAWMERYGGGLPTQKAPTVTASPTPRPTARPTPRPTTKPQSSDPYNASDYAHPDDFYYDHYDDFWDYEDAEDYWERYN